MFLDDVRVPDEDRLGQVNGGWSVAKTMLSAERGMLGGEGASPVARVGGVDVDTVIGVGHDVGPIYRHLMVEAWLRDRVVAMLSGRVGADARWAPLVKIAQAVHNQSLQELATQVVGPSAIANEGDGLASKVGWGLLRSRANSIGGGTSEILRNIVGESILELPVRAGSPPRPALDGDPPVLTLRPAAGRAARAGGDPGAHPRPASPIVLAGARRARTSPPCRSR